ncbi:hypothetical protein WR25_11327 isoform A [Diploscapter pachys]|uniref:Uncharacterized protein n=1 Tax=Diploscapter pachys TaxID=2018661 RepID=A0A2A2JIS1_9BILA|nr:hypothetical protein WR25_11327 isoform A [Diploscapter pachys]
MPDPRRTILITGSTDGIGRQTAADLAAHPENFVIIHGRSEEKCLAAKEFIANECGGSRTNLDFVVADLSVLSEVVELANEVERRFPSLNVLLCNAGVLNQRRLETKDGLEMMFQVNHLANFILARQLLPLLAKNAPARIGLVSTICYEWHPLDFSDLEAKNKYDMYEQYSKTKLMNFMFGLKLSREVPGGVTVNICEPGVVDTKLLRQGPYPGGPVKDGAISSIKLVMDSELDKINGAYYDSTGKRVQKLSEDSTDQAQQDKIWQVSEEIAVKHGVKF